MLIVDHVIWIYFYEEWDSVKNVCDAADDIKLEYECKIMTVAYNDNTQIMERNCNCTLSAMESFSRNTQGVGATKWYPRIKTEITNHDFQMQPIRSHFRKSWLP